MVNVKDGKLEVKKRLYNCKLVAISKNCKLVAGLVLSSKRWQRKYEAYEL